MSGDLWRDVREESQQRRGRNRAHGEHLLRHRGVPFVSHSNGVHLVVAERFDYWPGTGLWIERSTGKRGRGIRNLLSEVERG